MSDLLREKVNDATLGLYATERGFSWAVGGREEAVDEIMDEVVTPLVDLVTYLYLYMTRHTWTQLTTDQKNLLADLVDEWNRTQYEDSEPLERWWQT